MTYLTAKEAAEMLSDGLGRCVRAGTLEGGVEAGRIRGAKAPGRGRHYLIPVAEVIRILEDARDDTQPAAKAWDTLPPRGTDALWQTPWMTRRMTRPGSEGDRIAAVIARLRAMEEGAGPATADAGAASGDAAD